jgi:hypothetical protein
MYIGWVEVEDNPDRGVVVSRDSRRTSVHVISHTRGVTSVQKSTLVIDFFVLANSRFSRLFNMSLGWPTNPTQCLLQDPILSWKGRTSIKTSRDSDTSSGSHPSRPPSLS